MPTRFIKVERVAFEDDRRREALFGAFRSIEDRVLAGRALTDDGLIPRKHEPESDQLLFFSALNAAGVGPEP